MTNLPSNWQVKSLGEVANLTHGKGLPKELIQPNGKYPVYGSNGIIGFSNSYYSEDELLIIGRVGACGEVNFANGKKWITDNAIIVEPNSNMNFTFLRYFLIGAKLNRLKGGTSQPLITQTKLKSIFIPFPPLPIQKQIAEILEKADQAKQKRKEADKLTDEFLQSVFIEMFGDPVKNPKRWEKLTLPHIISKDKNSLKRGPFGSTLKKEIFISSGYLVYEQYHALNNDFTFRRYFIDEKKYKELEMFKISEGDLIVSCSGVYLGKIAEVPKGAPKGIINQALLKITLDKKIVSIEYFKFLWNTHLIQKILSLVSRGSGIPNFPSMTEVKSIEFPIPPIPFQQQFAEIVNKTEALKEKQKQSEQELENFFQSLMQRAFKGELV